MYQSEIVLNFKAVALHERLTIVESKGLICESVYSIRELLRNNLPVNYR